jgi:hexosaminidase
MTDHFASSLRPLAPRARAYVVLTAVLCVVSMAAPATAATPSPLFARGYTVIPEPQKVALSGKDFELTAPWRLELGPGVKADDVAVVSLKEGLEERFHFVLSGVKGKGGATLKLAIDPHAVEVGESADREKSALAEQAYRMQLTPTEITITGNSPTGLFYGVQTLVQLLKPQGGKLWLPEGEISDWPDLQLRVIYWDDAHHLEHLDVLKAALRQAAFYKINGFAIKLEGYFQYKSAAPIVEPYALSPTELQELTDYALHYHVELIPYLDAPAHDAFILKHPEYAKLREYAESNYEFCTTNPDTYKLFYGMFDDLLAANKGSKYIELSTDEPYFVGTAHNSQCDEATRAKQLGGNGKLLAEFITKTAGYLHDRGRQVLFWGEYPLEPGDIAAIPSYLINSEIYGPKFDPVFKAHGNRQMIFTSTVGWKEFLFPDYYLRPATNALPGPAGGAYQPAPQKPGIVQEMFDLISFTPERAEADLMGVFVAGWADTGLHPETFWLGYATGSAAGWHPRSPDPAESMSSFYNLFYGPGAENMGRLYQLMSTQAQFLKESWETVASTARTLFWGDYPHEVLNPPQPADDQTLPLLPVPSPDLLRAGYDWAALNTRRLDLAAQLLPQNDELLDLLHENQIRVEFNRYNLAVYASIAKLYRQNLEMLLDLARISHQLKSAEAAAGKGDTAAALAALDRALDTAEYIRQQRNGALQDATATWYESWSPRVEEANGRRFLDKVDDVKDHLPVRTVDMTYLVYRELLYPLGEWVAQAVAVRNQYAQAHHLPVREVPFDWKNTSTRVSTPRGSDDDN